VRGAAEVSRVGVGVALGVELHFLRIRIDRSGGFRLRWLFLGHCLGRLYRESDRRLWFYRRRGTEASSLVARRRVSPLREKLDGGQTFRRSLLPRAGRIDKHVIGMAQESTPSSLEWTPRDCMGERPRSLTPQTNLESRVPFDLWHDWFPRCVAHANAEKAL
jgi:hypothetical protein